VCDKTTFRQSDRSKPGGGKRAHAAPKQLDQGRRLALPPSRENPTAIAIIRTGILSCVPIVRRPFAPMRKTARPWLRFGRLMLAASAAISPPRRRDRVPYSCLQEPSMHSIPRPLHSIQSRRALPLVVISLASLTLASCSSGPARVNQPYIDASGAGAAAMDQYDSNGDDETDAINLQEQPDRPYGWLASDALESRCRS